MTEAGFNLFAPIWDGVTIRWNQDNLVEYRMAIDGYTLANRIDDLAPYFDAKAVWDEARGPWPGRVEGGADS